MSINRTKKYIAGGWDNVAIGGKLTEDIQKIFDTVFGMTNEIKPEPLAYLGCKASTSQYSFLCKAADRNLYVYTLFYRKASGEDEVKVDRTPIDIDALPKTADPYPVKKGAMVGGWDVCADEYSCIDNRFPFRAVQAFVKAKETFSDKIEYIPQAYLGSQIVSGVNYRFVCVAADTEKNASIKLVTVYQSITGSAVFSSFADINPAEYDQSIKLMCAANTSASLKGGYDDVVIGGPLPENAQIIFDMAFKRVDEIKPEPLVLLGTNAGTASYSILCRAADKKLYVYTISVRGSIEVSRTDFDINNLPATDDPCPTKHDPNIMGAWEVKADDYFCDESLFPYRAVHAFVTASDSLSDNVEFLPQGYFGSQIVSGQNYRFICVAKDTRNNASIKLVTVYQPLSGKAYFTSYADINAAEYIAVKVRNI